MVYLRARTDAELPEDAREESSHCPDRQAKLVGDQLLRVAVPRQIIGGGDQHAAHALRELGLQPLQRRDQRDQNSRA